MFKQLKLVAGLAIAATLVACGSTGNKSLKYESEDTISTKIIEGKTTKKEIQNIFGAPLVSSFDAGLLVWKYELEETSLDAISIPSILLTYGLAGTRSSGTKKQLTILFTDEGTVKKVNMSESPVTSGTMLFK
jgi:outer membrane protein assembly factor BamE (lipoprotein component of BamABCDE complex)